MQFPNPYSRADLRSYMLVPLALIVLSLYLALVAPGIPAGIDLKGGLLVTLQASEQVNAQALRDALAPFSRSVDVRTVSTPAGVGIEIELENNPVLEQAEQDVQALSQLDARLSEAEIVQGEGNATQDSPAVLALRKQIIDESKRILTSIGSGAQLSEDAHAAAQLVLQEHANAKQRFREQIISAVKAVAKTESISFREVGSSLSRFFLSKTREIVAIAFVLAAIVVFIVFRSLVPSFAVIFGAVADVTMTMGAMALLQIPLSLATIATLLMLIGFSLDTDIMLTMRVIKRRESTPEERAFEAMNTGFLMNLTTIGAFGALWLVAQLLQIPIYAQIGSVAVIGGFADFITTWLFNAPLIVEHVRKQEKKSVQ